MKKKEDIPKKGAPSYMNTYGDMMTLLLTFFVLLFSLSAVDATKFRSFVASFEGGMGIFEGGNTVLESDNVLTSGISQKPNQQNVAAELVKQDIALNAVKQDLDEYISEEKISEKLTVEKGVNEVIIRFDDVLLFDIGKADIKAGAIPVLNVVGIKLKEYIEQGYYIRLEGHTDNIPIRTVQFPSNWELSGARAIGVARFFIEEMDFDPTKLSAEGMGEYRPIAENQTVEGRSMNRRVEIKISKSNMSD